RPPLGELDEHLADLILGLGHLAEERGVPIPHDRATAQLTDTGQRLARLRADGDVPEADDLIDVFAFELAEDCIEREPVAVDVSDQAETHGEEAPSASAAGALGLAGDERVQRADPLV